MGEILAKAQRRKVRKGPGGNLSSFAMTEMMINACFAKLVLTLRILYRGQ
jgi:hypothetical protein